MKKGFTLAEVLIVIAIIGIVAVLTIPSLMSNYKKRVMLTQLQKAYSELSQAGALAVVNSNADSFYDSKAYRNNTFVRDYVKKQRDCGSNITCAFADHYEDDGSTFNIASQLGDDRECALSKSGYAICFTRNNGGILDVNGAKGPNAIGQDTFSIGFKKDGTVDEHYSMSMRNIIDNDWDYDY